MEGLDLMNVIILVFGIYILYAAVMLGVKDRIDHNIMAGRDKKDEMIRDMKGFKVYMLWRSLLLGIMTVFSGGYTMIQPQLGLPCIPEQAEIPLTLLYVGYICFYLYSVQEASKKFW